MRAACAAGAFREPNPLNGEQLAHVAAAGAGVLVSCSWALCQQEHCPRATEELNASSLDVVEAKPPATAALAARRGIVVATAGG